MIYKSMQVLFHSSMEADRALNTMAKKGWELVTWIPFDATPIGTPGASGFLVFKRYSEVDPDQRVEEEPSSTDTARDLFS